MTSDFYRGLILILLLLAAASCSAPPGPSPLMDAVSDETQDERPIDWAEYEDFDPEPYREPAGDPANMIRHDVPEILLSADVTAFSSSEEQSGFRIQVISTLDKKEADQMVEDALTWWQEFIADAALSALYPQIESEPPVYQDFRAPYYRVRIGNFRNREDAERLLDVVEKSYASAFIAPDRVLIGAPAE